MNIRLNWKIIEFICVLLTNRDLGVARCLMIALTTLMSVQGRADSNSMDLFFSSAQQQQIAIIKQIQIELQRNPHKHSQKKAESRIAADWVKLGGIAKTATGYRVWIEGRFWREQQDLGSLRVAEITSQTVTLAVDTKDSAEQRVLVRPGEFVDRSSGEVHRDIKPPSSIYSKDSKALESVAKTNEPLTSSASTIRNAN